MIFVFFTPFIMKNSTINKLFIIRYDVIYKNIYETYIKNPMN